MLGSTEAIHERRRRLLATLWRSPDRWRPPRELGGYDGSTHSRDLTALVNLGLVVRKRFYRGISSGHWRYRIRGGAKETPDAES